VHIDSVILSTVYKFPLESFAELLLEVQPCLEFGDAIFIRSNEYRKLHCATMESGPQIAMTM